MYYDTELYVYSGAYYRAKIQIWKQFTTYEERDNLRLWVLITEQRYKFESNSQQFSVFNYFEKWWFHSHLRICIAFVINPYGYSITTAWMFSCRMYFRFRSCDDVSWELLSFVSYLCVWFIVIWFQTHCSLVMQSLSVWICCYLWMSKSSSVCCKLPRWL